MAGGNLVVKSCRANFMDIVHPEMEDLVVLSCDCQGNLSQSISSRPGLPLQVSQFLEAMKTRWKYHDIEDCNSLGSFFQSQPFAFLVTSHSHQHHENPSTIVVDETEDQLATAVRLMLVNLPGSCTLHSPMSGLLNNGQLWNDIKPLLSHLLESRTDVDWVIWDEMEEEEDSGYFVESASMWAQSGIREPAEGAFRASVSETHESKEMLMSIMDEMKVADSLFGKVEEEESELEMRDRVPPMNMHRRAHSDIVSQFANVRNSIEVTKERKSKEKNSSLSLKDRLPYRMFSILRKKTSV